jgi:hypothetical protein
MSKWRTKSKPLKPKRKRKPRSRGPYGLSIVEAGKMIGLGRNASYDAAKAKKIPVLEFGGQKIVPRAEWLRKLGVVDAA